MKPGKATRNEYSGYAHDPIIIQLNKQSARIRVLNVVYYPVVHPTRDSTVASTVELTEKLA